MKIEHHLTEEITIEAFAERHDLTMEVHERRNQWNPDSSMRFYTHFKDTEVKEGSILRGTYGNGATIEEAINDYASQISEKSLVVDAMSRSTRREIDAPRFIPLARMGSKQ